MHILINVNLDITNEVDPRWAAASNAIVANIASRLPSNVWATADSTTNYLARTGGTMTGNLNMTAGTEIIGTNIIDSQAITDGTIMDVDINTGANIAGSKLADSAITSAKIADGAVATADIADGTIMDVDINTWANIAGSKVATATEAARGTVQLATDGQSAANLAVQANDSRLRRVAGNMTLNSVPRWDGAQLITGSIYNYPNNGNVGIGTASPGSKLTVQTAGAQHAFVSMKTDGTAGYVAAATFQRGSGSYWEIGSGVGPADNEFGVYSGDVGARVFTIKSGGNVGIGTASPNANEVYNRLTIAGTDNTALSFGIENAGPGQAALVIRRTGGMASRWYQYIPAGSTDLRLFNGADLVTFQSAGNVGIGTPSPTAKLDVNGSALIRDSLYLSGGDRRIQADWTGDGYPHFLALVAYPPTIADICSVLVPPPGGFVVANWINNRPNMWLHDNGDLGIAGKYYPVSDDRIKLNEQKLDYGLAQVMALEPKRYDLVEYEYDPETEELVIHPEIISRTNEIGLVAQQVQAVIPEAVSIPEDENRALWSMSYDTIIPILVKAIQEQQAQIEELKQEIQAMMARNAP